MGEKAVLQAQVEETQSRLETVQTDASRMAHAQKDDIIVLAGKGHETYQILGTVKTHLDEREEVAAYLAGD